MAKYPDGIYPAFKGPTAPLPDRTDLPIRDAFIKNDLRAYVPKAPVLLCGGNQDPSVTFDINTYAQAQIWQQSTNAKFAMIDVDISNQDVRASEGKVSYISTLPTIIDNEIQAAASNIQTGFADRLEELLSKAGPATEVEARKARLLQSYDYHTSVDPFCLNAANTFFDQYR